MFIRNRAKKYKLQRKFEKSITVGYEFNITPKIINMLYYIFFLILCQQLFNYNSVEYLFTLFDYDTFISYHISCNHT